MAGMDLVSIGDAARLLGLNTSALRYYEQRGLVRPVNRQHGRRMYDATQLRRLALIQIMQRLRRPPVPPARPPPPPPHPRRRPPRAAGTAPRRPTPPHR